MSKRKYTTAVRTDENGEPLPKQKQDRSKKSGHAHQKNCQDFPSIRLQEPEQSIRNLLNWWHIKPPMRELPPAARMAVDAVKIVVEQLEVVKEE